MQRLLVVGSLACGCAFAQFGRGGGDYATAGSDAQRSWWVRSDSKINREGMQKPGFTFLWKVKLNNEARQLNALTPPALLTRYIGYRGFRSLGFVGGSADKIFALDTDLGRIEWQKPVMSVAAPSGPSTACPGGMTASVTLPVPAAFPGGGGGRGGGFGRGAAAKSAVGDVGEGSAILKEVAARSGQNNPGLADPNAGAGRGRGGRGADAAAPAPGGAGGRVRLPSYLHSVSSDGMFHSMYVSNGDEPQPAVKFLPSNANAAGLTIVDGVAYAATTNNCGGAPNALWALDIASQQVANWQASSPIAGSDGAAIAPDGTLYVATQGGELVALEAKTLKVKNVHKAGTGFTTSPVVFSYKEQIYAATATKDGKIYLVDVAGLSGAGYSSPAYTASPDYSTGALASWQDAAGTRYILAATSTSIVAMKFSDQNGTPALQPAWTSRELVSPLTPLVIDGVVFATSSGEHTGADAKTTVQRSTPAVLYALDGATGREYWNSGRAIASFVHGGGISGGGNQVYLGTYDGTLYAFGFPMEH